MDNQDLCVPIYLNEQLVFDILAILYGGFAKVSTVSHSSEANIAKESTIDVNRKINILQFFGMRTSESAGQSVGTGEATVTSAEKTHTATSLFALARGEMRERGSLVTVTSADELGAVSTGDFVELKALLRKNPLIDAVGRIKGFGDLIGALGMLGSKDVANPGGKAKKEKNPMTDKRFIKVLDDLHSELTKSGSIEIVGTVVPDVNVSVVLSANDDFFLRGGQEALLDGEFSVVGKVVKLIKEEGDEEINLLSKTSLGIIGKQVLTGLSDSFSGAADAGLDLPEVRTSVPGPAIRIIPLAIFS
jgi:hypothetical protein